MSVNNMWNIYKDENIKIHEKIFWISHPNFYAHAKIFEYENSYTLTIYGKFSNRSFFNIELTDYESLDYLKKYTEKIVELETENYNNFNG